MNHILPTLVLLLLLPILSRAQSLHSPVPKWPRQALTGYYTQVGFSDRPLPEGHNYNPLIISAIYRWPVTKPGKRWATTIDIQPQFGWVTSQTVLDFTYEFGLNVGLSEILYLSKGRYLVATIGSGPHYTNVQTSRQAAGFIFSDNWLLSYGQPLRLFGHPVEVSLTLGFRHISNAGLKNPNGGLNDYIVGVSVLSR